MADVSDPGRALRQPLSTLCGRGCLRPAAAGVSEPLPLKQCPDVRGRGKFLDDRSRKVSLNPSKPEGGAPCTRHQALCDGQSGLVWSARSGARRLDDWAFLGWKHRESPRRSYLICMSERGQVGLAKVSLGHGNKGPPSFHSHTPRLFRQGKLCKTDYRICQKELFSGFKVVIYYLSSHLSLISPRNNGSVFTNPASTNNTGW